MLFLFPYKSPYNCGSAENSLGKLKLKQVTGISDARWCETPCKCPCCKDTQLGDSNVRTIWASERVGCGISLSFFTIITDPLRGSTSYLFLSPSCAQSLCDFRLHGVSHDAASPMLVVSNFCVVGICRIFLQRLAKVYAYSTKLALSRLTQIQL